MSLYQSILLGTLQGLTEFLPVSSSGHLVLAQKLIPGFSQPGILFDVVLHAGTLFSVLIYFRKTILKLTGSYLVLLIIGTLPAVIFGLAFEKIIESFFLSTAVVGFGLMVTSYINFQTDKTKQNKEKITRGNSLIIGISQAIAMIPGISRSGITIYSGSKLGISKQKATEFSFLLSVPAIIGANILQIFKNGLAIKALPVSYCLGFIAAFISGYTAINLALSFLRKNKFKLFAIYCFFAGVAAILLN